MPERLSLSATSGGKAAEILRNMTLADCASFPAVSWLVKTLKQLKFETSTNELRTPNSKRETCLC